MESSALIKSLAEIRESIGRPISQMQAVRELISRDAQRRGMPDLFSMLSDKDRELMRTNISKMEEFLRSEDGSDSYELFITSFREFIAQSVTDDE